MKEGTHIFVYTCIFPFSFFPIQALLILDISTPLFTSDSQPIELAYKTGLIAGYLAGVRLG